PCRAGRRICSIPSREVSDDPEEVSSRAPERILPRRKARVGEERASAGFHRATDSNNCQEVLPRVRTLQVSVRNLAVDGFFSRRDRRRLAPGGNREEKRQPADLRAARFLRGSDWTRPRR